MTRDELIDVLTVVAAATKRSVGQADLEIWGEIIGKHDKKSCLRAVRDHLAECPGVWLEPGHVHQRVRAFRRDELAREPDAMREARQEALAAKVAEDVEELAERRGIPEGPLKFQRPTHNYLSVPCPWCHASVGQHCVVPKTDVKLSSSPAHPSRRELVEAQS